MPYPCFLKRIFTLIIILSVSLFLINRVFPAQVQANNYAAYFYTNPESINPVVGSRHNVIVRINTGNDDVNAVRVHLTYSTDKLKFIASSLTDSQFPTEWDKSESNGNLDYSLYALPPAKNGNNLLALTLTFEVLKRENFNVDFGSKSGIFVADGAGSNVMNSDKNKSLVFRINTNSSSSSSSSNETSSSTSTPSQNTSSSIATTSVDDENITTPHQSNSAKSQSSDNAGIVNNKKMLLIIVAGLGLILAIGILIKKALDHQIDN